MLFNYGVRARCVNYLFRILISNLKDSRSVKFRSIIFFLLFSSFFFSFSVNKQVGFNEHVKHENIKQVESSTFLGHDDP